MLTHAAAAAGATPATAGGDGFGAATPFACGGAATPGYTPTSSRGGSRTPGSALACRLEGTPGVGAAGVFIGWLVAFSSVFAPVYASAVYHTLIGTCLQTIQSSHRELHAAGPQARPPSLRSSWA
jgi:hypothetical protein